jgi:uncharacterized protein (TIRG00374 family)
MESTLEVQESPEVAEASAPRARKWNESPAVHRALAWLTYLAGAWCLYYVFHKIKFADLVHQYSALKPGWLVLAMLSSMLIYLANAIRWVILVQPVLAEQKREVNFWRALQAVYIGLFFNEVLPLRPGEIIRCYLFSRWSGLTLSSTFASAVLERILDGVWMLTGFYYVVESLHLSHGLLTGSRFLLGGVIGGLATWLIWAQIGAMKRRKAEALNASRTGVHHHIAQTLELTSKPRTLIAAGLASVMPITCNIFSMWFLMKGFGLNLNFTAAMAVLLIIRLGTLIPNTPGNVGSYQFFCAVALGIYHIDKTASAAFSLLSFGVFTVPLLVGGSIAVVLSGFNMATLMSAGKNAEAAKG